MINKIKSLFKVKKESTDNFSVVDGRKPVITQFAG